MVELTEREWKIIQTYADNNMRKVATGKKLCFHRTWLYDYFAKIEAKTGLNPDNFYDLVELLGYRRGTP